LVIKHVKTEDRTSSRSMSEKRLRMGFEPIPFCFMLSFMIYKNLTL